MASTTVMGSTGLPTRDPDAVCARCNRHGTIAIVARGYPAKSIVRFCRQCWPAAEVETDRAFRAEIVAWRASFLTDRRLPDPDGISIECHWSAGLRGVWRMVRELVSGAPHWGAV
jgi:hypothetical protein